MYVDVYGVKLLKCEFVCVFEYYMITCVCLLCSVYGCMLLWDTYVCMSERKKVSATEQTFSTLFVCVLYVCVCVCMCTGVFLTADKQASLPLRLTDRRTEGEYITHSHTNTYTHSKYSGRQRDRFLSLLQRVVFSQMKFINTYILEKHAS